MSGVFAGSGGTGLLEGSRPGTGVAAGGLDPRQIPPTYIETYWNSGTSASTGLVWSTATPTLGDLSVGMATLQNAAGVYGGAINTLQNAGAEFIDELPETALGTDGRSWVSRLMKNVADGDNNDAIGWVTSGATNPALFIQRINFAGISVDGLPTIMAHAYCDGIVDSPFVLNGPADTITFPTIEVPEGYTFVYIICRHRSQNAGASWATATARQSATSTSGPDAAMFIATLDGPHAGNGVVFTQADNDFAGARGSVCAVIAVPGTP
jgi:hypothetical protein